MKRRAFTLVELLLSLGIGTTAMGTIVVVFGIVLQTDRLSHQQVYATAVVGRLSAAFRSDVHRAAKISSGNETMLALTMPDQSHIEYHVAPQGVVRNEEAADKTKREELFKLPAETSVVLKVDDKGKPIVCRLQIASAERAGVNLVIEAIEDSSTEAR